MTTGYPGSIRCGNDHGGIVQQPTANVFIYGVTKKPPASALAAILANAVGIVDRDAGRGKADFIALAGYCVGLFIACSVPAALPLFATGLLGQAGRRVLVVEAGTETLALIHRRLIAARVAISKTCGHTPASQVARRV